MLTDADRDRMRAELAQVRQDRAVMVAIRRGNATLAAQEMRIARKSSAAGSGTGSGATASITAITILGGVDLDIRVNDRFTVDGQLFEVFGVHPNRDVAIMADARLLQ